MCLRFTGVTGLLIFAVIELIRFYTHRKAYGPPPRLLTAGRIILVIFIVSTGVLANRIANNPAVISALRLPQYLSSLRDSVAGDSFDFTDAPVGSKDFTAGMKVNVDNSYGNVKVNGGSSSLKATLTKHIRGWNADDARRVAEQVNLTITRTTDGLLVTTSRNDINQDFTTDIQIDLPSSANLIVNNSYGVVTVNNLQNDVQIKTSHGQANVAQINGSINLDLSYSDVSANGINGDLKVNGAKSAQLSNINGRVDLTAVTNSGTIDLKEINGPLSVNAAYCSINAQGLHADSTLKTDQGKVEVARAANLYIDAPSSSVRAQNVSGNVNVSSSNRDIQLATVSGTVYVRTKNSAINIEDVGGAVDVETSHGDVSVKDFYRGVQVKTSYRNVTLVAAQPPSDNIDVKNNHGEIKLAMPSSSQFSLNATSENGDIRPIGFDGWNYTQSGESLVAGNGNGPRITLHTSFGNIIVQGDSTHQAKASTRVN